MLPFYRISLYSLLCLIVQHGAFLNPRLHCFSYHVLGGQLGVIIYVYNEQDHLDYFSSIKNSPAMTGLNGMTWTTVVSTLRMPQWIFLEKQKLDCANVRDESYPAPDQVHLWANIPMQQQDADAISLNIGRTENPLGEILKPSQTGVIPAINEIWSSICGSVFYCPTMNFRHSYLLQKSSLKRLVLFYLIAFGATLYSDQGLFLAWCLGIIPGKKAL